MRTIGWVIMLGALLAGAAAGLWDGRAEAGNGGDVRTTGDVWTNGDVGVNGDAGTNGDVSVNSDAGTNGDVSVNGDAGTNGDISVNGDVRTNENVRTNGDAATVLAFAQARMEPDSRMTLKWYGKVPAAEQGDTELVKFESRLVSALGLATQGSVLNVEGHSVYEAQDVGRDGVTGSVYVANGELILKLEAEGDLMAELLNRYEVWNRTVAGLKLKGRWLAAAQGWLQGSEGYGEAPERDLIQAANDELKASANGNYRDEGIISVTFTSTLLKQKASDTDSTALQIALHRDSSEGRWKLTVGTPMLTGEF